MEAQKCYGFLQVCFSNGFFNESSRERTARSRAIISSSNFNTVPRGISRYFRKVVLRFPYLFIRPKLRQDLSMRLFAL